MMSLHLLSYSEPVPVESAVDIAAVVGEPDIAALFDQAVVAVVPQPRLAIAVDA